MAVRAPDFRPELEWVNTDGRRLSLADFRGRVLLVDFWTYGCINCMHVLPVLRAMERRYGDRLAVVGVHSGKFAHERQTPSIARACMRLGVEHPVVNDRQLRMWREYAVRAWPTLVLVSPRGYVVWHRSGEIAEPALTEVVERTLASASAAGELDPRPLPTPPRERAGGPVLRFPAKVAASPDGRIFVADTGHHRVLELRPEGDGARVTRVIGTGRGGWRDGPAESAALRDPHGLALAGSTLYVADTGNHRIRSFDLDAGELSTVAGTGVQARRWLQGGPARALPLNSPWDLLWHAGRLYAAMAGWHQIWRVEPLPGWADPYIGSGAEELYDAELERAALAQPSGLATDGRRLFWVDPEASAVRAAGPEGPTETLVGTGLFDSGDRDGVGDEARLQHPLGVAWWAREGALLVADSYNHRIRRVDPATRAARALAGSGQPGHRDGPSHEARFDEPGGLAVSPDGRTAYVADTNNHALRGVDLRSGAVRTLRISE